MTAGRSTAAAACTPSVVTMTDLITRTPAAASSPPAGFIEKAPLERYVPATKPSLIGLSRVAFAEALVQIGVPEPQRKMRLQQLWHWIYVRGAQSFAEMTSISKEVRAS